MRVEIPEGLKRLRKMSFLAYETSTGAKARTYFQSVTARLKSCPDANPPLQRAFPQAVKSFPDAYSSQQGVFQQPEKPTVQRAASGAAEAVPFQTKFVRFAVAAFLLALLTGVNAAAEKIRVHYDHSLDFTKFKTYGWAPHGAVAHPMLALDMVGAIEDELNKRGLHKVAENPDLIIAIYGAVDSQVSMTSNNPIYNATGGIPPFDPSMTSPGNSLYWDSYYGNSTVVVYPGQLVIDLIEFKNKKLVWRAFAAEAISPNNPDKLESEANSTISKMFKEYPVKN